jgi:hypothetical protein
MMQQSAKSLEQPKRFEIFFHFIKTGKLIIALFKDRRVSIIRKALFVIAVAALLFVLFFPDLIDETILSLALPAVGTVLGVPLDAGIDWMAFALLAVNLLRIFPPEIVAEHYTDIF